MSFNKVLRWGLISALALLILLVVLLVLVAFVPIKLDLSSQRGLVESVTSRYLDRQVRIEGGFNISTSLWPALEVGNIHIGNPQGFTGDDLLVMKEAKLSLDLLSLLRGKIHIGGVSIDGLDIRLIKNSEGNGNWVFHPPEKAASKSGEDGTSALDSGRFELTSDSLVIKSLEVTQASVTYQGPNNEPPINFRLDKSSGTALPGKPLILTMRGSMLEEGFSGELQLGSLQELIEDNRSWTKFSLEIAETRFDLEGGINILPDSHILEVRVGMAGDKLSSLNQLLDLDLPPLKDYKAETVLSQQKGQVDLSKLVIKIGSSSLQGNMKLDISGQPAIASVDLSSPLTQLDDFDLGDWSPEPEVGRSGDDHASAEKSEKTPTGAEDGEKILDIMSPEVLKRVNIDLKVAVEKVLSGKDELGSGLLVGSLKDGRIQIEPLTLNLPGGSFEFALSLKPGKTASEAELRAKVENFDVGVIARKADPDSDVGGTISLDVDLQSTAGSTSGLMEQANGYFDLSGHPVNLRAGVIDLWAVNLIASIMAKGAENESQINCLVGRLKMEDGKLTPEIFVIDTSKIRICGSGQADFKQRNFAFSMVPTPKRPEFFSLATPFQVSGDFEKFDMGVGPGGLIGTTISWVTSPLIVPLRRLAGEKLPADGGDVCNVTLGPSNRPEAPAPGCIHP